MKLGKPTSVVPKDTYRKEYTLYLLDFIASRDRIRVLSIPEKQLDSTYEIVGELLSRDSKTPEPRFAGVWRTLRNGVIYLIKEQSLWVGNQQ